MDINSNYEVVISDSAKAELDEIYSNLSEKAEKKLMEQIEENVLRLEQFPYSCSEVRVKPHKEVNEYLADYSVEEMADVMEVIYAMLDYRGMKMEDVEKVRIEKRNRKGAFKNKVFLKTVEEN